MFCRFTIPLFLFMVVVAIPEPGAHAAEADLVLVAPMPDGVGLSTAVYLPDPGAFMPPYPTVLIRTPYPDVLGSLPPEIADMVITYMVDMFGLALVVQDTRGTGDSGGDPDAFFSDWTDGPATIDWIVSQDWCDGQVMQFGLSALAIPGYLAAPGAPDNLKCQFLGEAAPDMYNLAAFHGGVFKKDTVESWLSWVGASSMLSRLSDHRDCDDFWNPLMLDRIQGDIHSAAMHIGGWYDVFTEGTIAGYRAYSDRGDEWASRHQYLVIGPWDHWTLANALGDASSPGYSLQTALLSWTSFCLAGDKSQIADWPRVRYYVMGSSEADAPGNEWRTSPDWPLPAEYRSFEVGQDGVLADHSGIVFPEPAADVSTGDDAGDQEAVLPATIPFSHADWSPVVGGRNLTGSSGPADLKRVLARDDYVMFATEQLAEPFESIGRMSAVLDVSTSFGDADIVVRLADIYPDGTAILLSDGAARMSRREGCGAAVDVEAGKVYGIEVDLLSSAMVFNTGHRIAVIVTSTMYPKYEFNPVLESESRANGPVDDAFVIHGGRLLMPVSSPIVEIPDTVETPDAAETVETVPEVETGEPSPDAGDAWLSDADSSMCADSTDLAVVPDDGDGYVTPDARDGWLTGEVDGGQTLSDRGGGEDGGIEHNPGGGCSAAGSRSRGPVAGLFLQVAAFVSMLLFRRRTRSQRAT